MSKIHLISGPRNISTALMYSFGNRADMTVIDEPFYAYYLTKHPEVIHPGKAETLKVLPHTYEEVLQNIIHKDYPTEHIFFKNMAHHLDQADWSFIKSMNNLFLIRDPHQLIASFSQVIQNPTMLDIGLKLEWELFEYATAHDAKCVIADSNEILKNPELVLRRICDQLEISFSNDMLSWNQGARSEDGPWAKYWYANVHKSTGFKKQETSARPFPARLKPLLLEAQKYYDRLVKYSIRA